MKVARLFRDNFAEGITYLLFIFGFGSIEGALAWRDNTFILFIGFGFLQLMANLFFRKHA